MRQDSLNWDDIRIFRDKWPGVLMLKGINRVDDALKAVSYGVDGIIVSNHGGRNMDSAAATLDMLVAATDVYLWKLVRRDMRRSRDETLLILRRLVDAALAQVVLRASGQE